MSPRPEKGIIAHNYQRLINKIKGSATEHYNPEEYRRAFHNPMFSHLVNKAIVKHPSDWYYKKNDSVWQNFLNMLSEEAPLWRSYSEEFLDSMVWMQDLTNDKVGPEVWDMHPLVFLAPFLMQNYPVTPIENTLTPLEFLHFYNGDIIDDNDYLAAAEILECEVAAIKAVAMTETGSYGSYFKFQNDDDYVPTILFERHHFRKYTAGRFDQYADISNGKAGGYGGISTQYSKLLKAYNLDKTAALKSASWGKFQILGSNYSSAGYSTPEDFVFAMSESEKNQLNAFVNFIKSNNKLLKSIREKDWLTFAKTYNGPLQKGYDKKMEKNYEIFK
ncbi:N-acetylmuramidase family protein [Providencia stuartii]|uniref:N-acetylmuramidase family protein n=2 Tax=Providencia stuartii TaxID=588 RepID=UPI00332C6A61